MFPGATPAFVNRRYECSSSVHFVRPPDIHEVKLTIVFVSSYEKTAIPGMGKAVPAAMASMLSPSTVTETLDPPEISEYNQNAADISAIVVYFVVVMAVGLWVCRSLVGCSGWAHVLGGKMSERGKSVM
ncbi:hypothetical protein EI555_012720 [Monodon monoceros]|uniref:Uncharacterized protein n=1 Tax=Monodon monoceros TaxID=40151 RepID=A0A4U1F5M3_MONMO|nr:hypothetical protein EI555_012720 [Monodon monoceros]